MGAELMIAFDIPAEPLTLNKKPAPTPWGAKKHRAIKHEWYAAAYYATVAAFPGVGPAGRAMGPCDVYISIPVWGSRTRDPSNWTPTSKPIVDAIKDAGVWPDDSPEWVREHISFREIKTREIAMKSKVIVRLLERTRGNR